MIPSLNILPPQDIKVPVYVKKKIPINGVSSLHETLNKLKTDKPKNESLMVSLLQSKSMRYLKEFTTHYWGICVDVDDGNYDYVLGELKQLNYNYYMYQTHSHMKANPENDNKIEERFRFIIVLDKFYKKEDFLLASKGLKKFFAPFNIDDCTFTANRRYIVPPSIIPSTGKPNRIESNSTGELLNLKSFIEDGKKNAQSKKRFDNIMDRQNFKKTEKGMRNYIKKIDSSSLVTYPTLTKLFLKFTNDGFKHEQIKQAITEISTRPIPERYWKGVGTIK